MKKLIMTVVMLLTGTLTAGAVEVRVKDMVHLKGMSETQLIGYGLVVGLPGTGDRYETIIANQSMKNMLEKFGIQIEKDRMFTRNTAAVMVTAKLTSFAKEGNLVDVTVSALGDAKSLTGGTMLMTTLRGPDGRDYVSCQGAITAGGYEESQAGFRIRKNFPVVGTIANGGVVLADLENDILKQDDLYFILRDGDFSMARQLATNINTMLSMEMAQPEDNQTVKLSVPVEYKNKVVELISLVNALKLNTDEVAKIVINERTGTVVIGENVKIAPVAISHGDLIIKVKNTTKTSQPLPFTLGETTVENEIQETVEEENKHLVVLQEGTSIQDVVNALNSIGAAPRDVISILQAMKTAGALHANIEII